MEEKKQQDLALTPVEALPDFTTHYMELLPYKPSKFDGGQWPVTM